MVETLPHVIGILFCLVLYHSGLIEKVFIVDYLLGYIARKLSFIDKFISYAPMLARNNPQYTLRT
jgi:hypothetical protein